MRRTVLSITFVLFCSIAFGQKMKYTGFPSMVWPKLYNISFEKAKDERGEFDKPVFTEAVRALRNKTIVLPGYMVPLENESSSSRIMLSSLPLNACFFCGVGGPETVVEVHLKNKIGYIEQPIEVRGVLRLNETDPDKMIYILEQADVLGPIEF